VTRRPARLAGAEDKIGAVQPGLYADLLVLHPTRSDPYENLDHSDPADVDLVVIDGQPVYGRPQLARQARPDAPWVDVPVGRAAKAVAFPAPTPEDDWAHTTAALEAALNALGTHLGPLVE
jgi:hypothetical protein